MYKIYLLLLFALMFSVSCNNNSPTDSEESEEIKATASRIDLSANEQLIRGFGAANIVNWRPDMTSDEINKAFSTEDGNLGFSILRLRIPSQQSECEDYVSTAKAAYDMGVKVVASPWTPPANLKTNNDPVGGALADTAYDDYARHLNDYIDYMSDNGVELYGVSVQNEPDIDVEYESCDWTSQQRKRFVLEYGDMIKTRLMAPESFQFRKEMADPILNDSEAAENLDIVGGHIYAGGLEPSSLAETKGKELWMTEHYTTSDRSANLWPAALEVGSEIHQLMSANMNAYIWWYIVRYYGPIGDGEESTTKGAITKRGYVVSQFSRFIRPGYHRIGADENPKGEVYVTAYQGDDKAVVVAVNMGPYDREQQFVLENSDHSITSMISYKTSENKNVAKGESLTISDEYGTFTYEIPSHSIVTLLKNRRTE